MILFCSLRRSEYYQFGLSRYPPYFLAICTTLIYILDIFIFFVFRAREALGIAPMMAGNSISLTYIYIGTCMEQLKMRLHIGGFIVKSILAKPVDTTINEI